MSKAEENQYYQMYLEELQSIAPCTEEEIEELSKVLESGNIRPVSRLVEGNLHRVLPIAAEFAEKYEKVLLEDLVQEGNMALTMAAGDYSDGGFGPFVPYIEKEIRRAMTELVGVEDLEEDAKQAILKKVQKLNDATVTLAGLLGRQATTDELAKALEISEDEVKEIAKITLDALTRPDIDPVGVNPDDAAAPAEDDGMAEYFAEADRD